MARLERNVFPWIGTRQMTEITVPELISVLSRTEDRGAYETAHRVQGKLQRGIPLRDCNRFPVSEIQKGVAPTR